MNMNKPSWDDAPEWAMWLGIDADGCCMWFSMKPSLLQGWEWVTDGKTEGRKIEHAGDLGIDIDPYLEPRP